MNKIVRVGYVYGYHNHSTHGRVYSPDGIAPTLLCGGKVTGDIAIKIIEYEE